MNHFYNYFITNETTDETDYEFGLLLEQHETENLPLEQTPYTYIDTREDLLILIEEIEAYAKELAVDLEHHSQSHT